MTFDLTPRDIFSFPNFRFPSLMDDAQDWITTSSGLSISEDENNVYIETALPGIEPNKIDITFHDGNLWVKGEITEEEKDKNRKYYRKATNSFSYRVAIPGDIDTNSEPKAEYKNGIMTVTFVKSPKMQPKKIKVTSGS